MQNYWRHSLVLRTIIKKRTWRQILTEAAGVNQHIGLKGGIKLIMSTGGQQHTQWWASLEFSSSAGCWCVLVCNIPVVKQYVRCPHLVRSETEVLNSRVLWLVPLEVVVVPLLRDTSTALAWAKAQSHTQIKTDTLSTLYTQLLHVHSGDVSFFFPC